MIFDAPNDSGKVWYGGLQCSHLDDNPHNNSIDNLHWLTPGQNTDKEAARKLAIAEGRVFYKYMPWKIRVRYYESGNYKGSS